MLGFRRIPVDQRRDSVPVFPCPGEAFLRRRILIFLYVAIAAGLVALAFAGVLTYDLLRQDRGSKEVQFIGDAIQRGAMAFLGREYRMLALFVVVVTVILAVLIDWDVTDTVGSSRELPSTAISYLAGAVASALADSSA